MVSTMKIKQKKYSDISIDNKEKDVVIIWLEEKEDSQCVHIERGNIDRLIIILEQCKK